MIHKISPLPNFCESFFEKARFQAVKLCIHFFKEDFCRIFKKFRELRHRPDGRLATPVQRR